MLTIKAFIVIYFGLVCLKQPPLRFRVYVSLSVLGFSGREVSAWHGWVYGACRAFKEDGRGFESLENGGAEKRREGRTGSSADIA